MGKIKGWSLLHRDKNMTWWISDKDSSRKVNVRPFTNNSRKTGSITIDGYRFVKPRQNISDSAKFDTRSEARTAAIAWMRRHPNG